MIKTRFTPARGYIVESKRGGGGYIRIVKVKLTDDQDLIQIMRQHIPSRLRMRDARDLIQELFDNGLIARQSGNLMLAVMDHETLGIFDQGAEEHLRSRLFLAFWIVCGMKDETVYHQFLKRERAYGQLIYP